MKKIIAIILSFMLSITPAAVSFAVEISEAELQTDVNRDLLSEDGETIIDDTYQYCVENDEYFAYMWVPQNAEHLNGVLLAKSNLIEARLMQSKTVRGTLAKYNIGMVYLHARNTTDKPTESTIIGDFDYRDDAAAGSLVDEMMARFAAVSGYDELLYAPFIGVGHSAGMGPGRALGSWDPTRVIAQVCLKGGTSLTIPGISGTSDIQPGVPTYLESGQFTEHSSTGEGKDNYIDNDIPKLKDIRSKGTDRLVTMSVEWESGHYDWSEKSNKMLAAYLDSVIPLRLGDQAFSKDKIQSDYVLTDLTGKGYVSDIKVLGTRTIEYAESEYSHGSVETGGFTEAEQKQMIWFPDENVYKAVRNFTNDRKDAELIGGETDAETQIIYPEIEQQFDSKTGAKQNGNYVRYDKSMLFSYDISDLSQGMIDSAAASFTVYHGNQGRSFKISYYTEDPTGGTNVSVPTEDNSEVLESSLSGIDENSMTTVSFDISKAIFAARANGGNTVYLAIEITDSEKSAYEAGIADGSITGYPSSYSGSDMYLSITSGVSNSTKPQLKVIYSNGEKVNHQYVQLEDPTEKTPKVFPGNLTRYNAVNPNADSYADGIQGDPMTFSMYVDKMGVVSPDHIGAGTKVDTSDTPAVITPVMAPVEWVGVTKAELTESDIQNNVASKWRNVLRWKNNRLYYRISSQDSYLNLNTFDKYDESGRLNFAYATNTFQIYPIFVNDGAAQMITFDEITDVDKNFSGFTVNPKSSAGLPVDLFVDYGPIKAEKQADGSYKIIPDQIPAGASYPIECKLVASQFGVNHGNKINTAEPIERVFYITDSSELSSITSSGKINQNLLLENNITGFNVSGSGTVTLKTKSDTKFDAAHAAAVNSLKPDDHYKYPSGYDPKEYWDDYPGEWTAETSGGFLPLADFVNAAKGRGNINLRYLNEIEFSSGITAITPVAAQTEVKDPKANPWGNGVNIVWSKPIGDAYDSVKVEMKSAEDAAFAEVPSEQLSIGASNAFIKGLDNGEYIFRIKTVKNGAESSGVEIKGSVDASKYLLDDFENGDLTSGMNWLVGADVQSAYSWSTHTGASVLLSSEGDNGFMAVQNTYTSAVQTMNISIPGGLSEDMTKLVLDIKVDKLEDTYPGGQVYFELMDPKTGKAYGVEKGSDFVLNDKEWHQGYEIPLTSFNLPSSGLEDITILKIGRKVVGGGNNNRRAKMYLDNIGFSAEPPAPTRKLSGDEIKTYANNDELPDGAPYDSANIGYLFDGDTSNTENRMYTSSAKKYTYFDLGAEYEITKIVLTEYTTKGTLTIMASNSAPDSGGTRDELFKQILRTNGSVSNRVSSSYQPITEAGEEVGRTAIAIYMAQGFEKIRYLCIGDWSNAVKAAELEIYVIDNDPVSSAAPEATSTPVVTAAPEVTSTPVVTAVPEVTSTPVVTAAPEVTSTPVVTAAPEVTSTPVVTAAPEVTSTPVVTAAPEVTSTPVVTATPEMTSTPEPASTPDPTSSPGIVIEGIDQNDPNKTVVSINLNDPADKFVSGTIIVAEYDKNGICTDVKFLTEKRGNVELNKQNEGYIKVFLWSGISDMIPLISPVQKDL